MRPPSSESVGNVRSVSKGAPLPSMAGTLTLDWLCTELRLSSGSAVDSSGTSATSAAWSVAGSEFARPVLRTVTVTEKSVERFSEG